MEGRESGWELDSGAQGQGVGENRWWEQGRDDWGMEERQRVECPRHMFYFGATVPHINKFKHVIL